MDDKSLEYDIDFLEKVFQAHDEEFQKKLEKSKIDCKKMWPDEDYNPSEFS